MARAGRTAAALVASLLALAAGEPAGLRGAEAAAGEDPSPRGTTAGPTPGEPANFNSYLICAAKRPSLCLGQAVLSVPGPLELVRSEEDIYAFWKGDDANRAVLALMGKFGDDPTPCVDVRGHEAKKGAVVQLQDCNLTTTDQQFVLPPGLHGLIRWADYPGFCLEVKDHTFKQGAPIQIWRCQRWNNDQHWVLKPFVWGP